MAPVSSQGKKKSLEDLMIKKVNEKNQKWDCRKLYIHNITPSPRWGRLHISTRYDSDLPLSLDINA